jgi:hypothetical protein
VTCGRSPSVEARRESLPRGLPGGLVHRHSSDRAGPGHGVVGRAANGLMESDVSTKWRGLWCEVVVTTDCCDLAGRSTTKRRRARSQ